MKIQTIQLDGVEVHTRTYGDPSRRPVLCLHSLFLNGAMFHDWAEYVSEELFVVAPDLRGQGRSPDTENQAILDMDLYAQDIHNFLSVLSEQYGITTVGILAQSMGGDVDDIHYIVKQHMRMKVFDKMKWTKQDKMRKDKAFGKLQKFTKFDRGGRK